MDECKPLAVGKGATRAAHLEDQCDRHRRMLQAWSDAASQFSRVPQMAVANS